MTCINCDIRLVDSDPDDYCSGCAEQAAADYDGPCCPNPDRSTPCPNHEEETPMNVRRTQELRRSNAAQPIPSRRRDEVCDCGSFYGDGTDHSRCWMIP